jgi:hypothetical protein
MSSRGGCWPTEQQEQLLRAALLSGPESLQAWESWRNGVDDVMTLDAGSVRMLPLLYRNLKAQGVDHPWMGRFRGTYRKAWYQNRVLLHHAAEVLRALTSAGLPSMVLKGAALASSAYGDLALRPMNDVDVLVRTEDAQAAMAIFDESGLRPTHSVALGRMRVTHSVCFVDRAGRQIDLHWHVLEDDCRVHADDAFWARAVRMEIDGVETRALDTTDQLFHTCAHGARWNRVPPYRWVADAAVIVRTGVVDWDRLVDLAEHHLVVPQILHPLGYLVDLLDLEVPATTLERLARLGVLRWMEREYRLKTLPETILRRVLQLWFQHRRIRGGSFGLNQLTAFPGYLVGRWGMASISDFSRFVRAELAQRLNRKLAR